MTLKYGEQLKSEHLAPFAKDLIAGLYSKSPMVRTDATELLRKLEPSDLEPHAETIKAILDESAPAPAVRRMVLQILMEFPVHSHVAICLSIPKLMFIRT